MKLLLINSGDKNPFASLYDGNGLSTVYSNEFNSSNTAGKPDNLINCLVNLSSRISFKELDAIAVTIGPGSFTGIRVGLSLAKGIAFGINKPLIPVNNFELLLQRVPDSDSTKKYCVIIPSKLPEYYYAVIEKGIISSFGAENIENISKLLNNEAVVVGDFDDETQLKHCYFSIINLKNGTSEPESLANLAVKYFNEGYLIDSQKVQPFYIKEFNLKKP